MKDSYSIFFLVQVYHDSEEGKKYRQFYKVNEWPYVAVLDPRTGTHIDPGQQNLYCKIVNNVLTLGLTFLPIILTYEPVHEISNNLTCADSDEPLQPPFKLRNSKWCSVNSLTIIEYSSD